MKSKSPQDKKIAGFFCLQFVPQNLKPLIKSESFKQLIMWELFTINCPAKAAAIRWSEIGLILEADQ